MPCIPIWVSPLLFGAAVLNYLIDTYVYCWGFYMYIADFPEFIFTPVALIVIVILCLCYRNKNAKEKPLVQKTVKVQKTEKVETDVSNLID